MRRPMNSVRAPAVFLSHGAPTLALEHSPAGQFLDALASRWPRPAAIVVASAHYPAAPVQVGAAPRPETWHDFRGFPAPLHVLQYPAAGSPGLAQRIVAMLQADGIEARLDPMRRLDHGVWVPLLRMWPDANIPVVPLSVDPHGDAASHLRVGRSLHALRDEGVMVLGSGGFVHNLGALEFGTPDAPLPDWAAAFMAWMHAALARGDMAALERWRDEAPFARQAHPTVEHLMPLFVAAGAALPGEMPTVLHRSHEYGSLALDAFAWEG